MTDRPEEEVEYYNLEGGQRHLVRRGGEVKAVAPGLRLVPATDDERQRVEGEPAAPPPDHGLPV